MAIPALRFRRAQALQYCHLAVIHVGSPSFVFGFFALAEFLGACLPCAAASDADGQERTTVRQDGSPRALSSLKAGDSSRNINRSLAGSSFSPAWATADWSVWPSCN